MALELLSSYNHFFKTTTAIFGWEPPLSAASTGRVWGIKVQWSALCNLVRFFTVSVHRNLFRRQLSNHKQARAIHCHMTSFYSRNLKALSFVEGMKAYYYGKAWLFHDSTKKLKENRLNRNRRYCRKQSKNIGLYGKWTLEKVFDYSSACFRA